MTQVSTDQLMQMALERAGMTEIPADSAIYHSGTRISNVLVGLEIGVAELFMARQLGYHAVIGYAPAGNTGPTWDLAVEQHHRMMRAAGIDDDRANFAFQNMSANLHRFAASQVTGRAPALAREVDLPFLSIQAPIADLAQRIVQGVVDDVFAANPAATVADLRDALRQLPPFAADQSGLPPLLWGNEDMDDWAKPLGRVAVLVGCSVTPPSMLMMLMYFAAGFDTICYTSGTVEWGSIVQSLQSLQTSEPTVQTPSDMPQRSSLNSGTNNGTMFPLGRMACVALGMTPYVADMRARGLEVTVMGDLPGLH